MPASRESSATPAFDQSGHRRGSEPLAWFVDLYRRHLLDLDPPYQRRSVWNQAYKDAFVETILLSYPAPPVFLYEVVDDTGVAKYAVVDGKQRLSTVIEFTEDQYAAPSSSSLFDSSITDRYFSALPDQVRTSFWRYQLGVEFLPTVDQVVLSEVFNRLNRNVARLTPQELRHAQFSGAFASSVEAMADYMFDAMPKNFPRIADASRRQMKDLELTAQLLLFLVSGPHSFSQDELDAFYAASDAQWMERRVTEKNFRRAIDYLGTIAAADSNRLAGSRLRNQADFYSLFGAIAEGLEQLDRLPSAEECSRRLGSFIERVDDPDLRAQDTRATDYFSAARSASNDASRRRTRIDIIKSILF